MLGAVPLPCDPLGLTAEYAAHESDVLQLPAVYLLAGRLTRDVRFEDWVVGSIMRRCFSVYALRLLNDQFDQNRWFDCEADDIFCDDWVVKLMRRNESEVDEAE